MNRYGGDYRHGWGTDYDAEHRHWGSNPRYDHDFGFRSGISRYDRDSGFRGGTTRYDRDFGYRGGWPGYDRDFGYGSRSRGYDRSFRGFGHRDFGPEAGYDRGWYSSGPRFQGYGGMNRGRSDWNRQEMNLMMTGRQPVSAWGPSIPGQDFGYSLGYGVGANRYFYK